MISDSCICTVDVDFYCLTILVVTDIALLVSASVTEDIGLYLTHLPVNASASQYAMAYLEGDHEANLPNLLLMNFFPPCM